MSHLSAFGPIVWAKRVPTMSRNGRPDTTAHHVLLALATYARRDGTQARPSVDTLAEDTRLTTPYVIAALERIQAAGLITQTGEWNGVPVWKLDLEQVASGPSVQEQRAARQRAAAAERQRRYRERKAAPQSGHAPAERDVTAPQTVTVTVPEAVTSRGEQRDVTVPQTVSHAPVTVTPAAQTPRIPLELPRELPKTDPPAEAFDRFWSAYPRRTGKAGARKKFATALKTAPAEAIIAGAVRYAAERAADKRPDAARWTKHPVTWLNQGCWDDEPAAPVLLMASGAYQPYQNPVDQSIYDEDLS